MRLSKLFTAKLIKSPLSDKIVNHCNLHDIGDRATGKTTAYCLRIMYESMERPEVGIKIQTEPRIGHMRECANIEFVVNCIKDLIIKTGLDWLKLYRKQGEWFIVYEPYDYFERGYVKIEK